jgi:hypothetical protein
MAAPMTPAGLRKKAEHYRALACTISDPRTIDALQSLAAEFEKQADRLEQDSKPEER